MMMNDGHLNRAFHVWENRKLSEDITLVSGQHVMARDVNTQGEGVAYLTGPADFPNGVIEQTKFTTRPSKMCQPGDILVTVKGSGAGSLVRADREYCISRQLMSIRSNTWNTWFVYYSLLQNASRIKEASAGLIPGLSRSDILDQSLPVPATTLEQNRISSVLRDCDNLIATLERLIAKKQAIKQGMMQQLLTGSTRLPGFTGKWMDIRLGDHVSYLNTVALSRAQLDTTSKLKYLHYGDIHTRSSALLDSVCEEMPRAAMRLAARAGRLRPGDLVFADASEDPAGVGKSVEIVNTPGTGLVPGLHTIAARFEKSVLADGFKAYLQFIPSFRNQLLRLAAGTKVLATTRSYISSTTLMLPDVAEQKAIAEVLHDSEREIHALRARLSKAKDIKKGMMQQLLTGRTRLPVVEAL